MDEPALWVKEAVRRVLNPQGHTEDHRFLHILVAREPKPAEYVEDLGLASQFPGEQFILYADREPVGRLLDMAQARREARPYAEEAGIEPPDLINGYYEHAEERWKAHLRTSTFGSLIRRQRD